MMGVRTYERTDGSGYKPHYNLKQTTKIQLKLKLYNINEYVIQTIE